MTVSTGAVRRISRTVTPSVVAGAAMIVAAFAFMVTVMILPSYDPFTQNLSLRFVPPFTDAHHFLGTDALGRDLASRVALGGFVSIGLVLGVVALNSVIGLVIGTVAGYFRGGLENLLMGYGDVLLAVPPILIVIALSAVFGPSVWLAGGVLAVTIWVAYARVCRSIALGLREREFVIASRLFGAKPLYVLVKHIVPQAVFPLIILATSDLGAITIVIASFDYLGLGVQPPVPSLGLMISEGQKYLSQAPNLTLIPGVVLVTVIYGVVLISEHFTSGNADLRHSRVVTGGR